VRNLSRPDGLHAEFIVLSAPYDAPPNKVLDALAAAIAACPRVLREPAPRMRLHRYADSGIDYQVKLFLRDVAGLPDIRSQVQVQVWYEFRRAGISFPYPVRELRRLPDAQPTQRSTEEIRARLQATGLFAALPEDLLAQLVVGTRTLDFGDGECVVAEGAAGDACYVVDEGRVVVSVSGGAAQRKVAELGPGSMFGEMSLLTGEARSASVHAIGDARLLALSSDVLGPTLQQHPDLAQTLAELVTLRREGLVEARSQLDADTKARVARESVKLGALIRRFLHLPPRG
jgi:CRP-like cAMP-binding protein